MPGHVPTPGFDIVQFDIATIGSKLQSMSEDLSNCSSRKKESIIRKAYSIKNIFPNINYQ